MGTKQQTLPVLQQDQKTAWLKGVSLGEIGWLSYTHYCNAIWYSIASVRDILRISWSLDVIEQEMLYGINVIKLNHVDNIAIPNKYGVQCMPPNGVTQMLEKVLHHRDKHSVESVRIATRLYRVDAGKWLNPGELAAELTTEEMDMESNIIDGQNKEMNMEITVFNFKAHEVRTVLKDGEPWFVAKDVCDVLEITNSRDAVAGLDEDEKGVGITDTLGGKQSLVTISESGLYALIFKSRKPEAKAFRKWVTSEVLPALRKTGRYEIAPAPKKTWGHCNLSTTEMAVEFGRWKEIASLAGLDSPSAATHANDVLRKEYGVAPLDIAGIVPTQQQTTTAVAVVESAQATVQTRLNSGRQYLIPRDIAEVLATEGYCRTGNPGSQYVNNMLFRMGLQVKSGKKWVFTDSGREAGGIIDVRTINSGSGIAQQLYWPDSIVGQIKKFVEATV